MGRRIGICSAAVNLAAVLGFAASMALGFNWGSYFSSMFIALSYVAMACAWARFAGVGRELAGRVAEAFAAMYAVLVLRVYFAQLTTVRFGGLTRQAADLLDFQRGNLMFYDDLLGYALMALSTFFAGLTVEGRGALAEGSAHGAWRVLSLLHGAAPDGRASRRRRASGGRARAGGVVRVLLPHRRSGHRVFSWSRLRIWRHPWTFLLQTGGNFLKTMRGAGKRAARVL